MSTFEEFKDNLKEKFNNCRLQAKSKLYILSNINTKYDFFGYLVDEERGLPFFEKAGSGYSSFKEFVVPYTPEMLAHCVNNLTKPVKEIQAENIQRFESRCTKIALQSTYTGNWSNTIKELKEEISKYQKQEQVQ